MACCPSAARTLKTEPESSDAPYPPRAAVSECAGVNDSVVIEAMWGAARQQFDREIETLRAALSPRQPAPSGELTIRIGERDVLMASEAMRRFQIPETQFWDAIRDRDIDSVKVGGTRWVFLDSL